MPTRAAAVILGTTTCVAHVRAWTLLLVHAPSNTTQRLTYYVDPSFCAHVLPQFHEDRILSFRTLDCASVRAYVRAGFDAWQHNAHVSFHEVEEAGDVVDVIVDGRALNDENATATTLAQVRLTRDRKARLTVDADACWYVDSAFCHAFSAHATLVQILLASAWLTAVGAVAWLVCRPVAPYGGTVRLVAWALLIAPPLVYWGALTPCLECHDFGATVAHEVGHVLGLGHPDDATRLNRCGCGDAATPCAYASSSSSPPIMHSVARSRGRACLQRDDVDGARTRYGGNCSAPVWCYEEASYAGFARFAVALVYAFAAAWLAVSVRVCAWRWWHKRKRTHVLQQPQRHSSSLSERRTATQRSHKSHPR